VVAAAHAASDVVAAAHTASDVDASDVDAAASDADAAHHAAAGWRQWREPLAPVATPGLIRR
jgi:hypothetical protein